MKSSYLISYDITEPKVYRRIIKLTKPYGNRWQKSLFFCSFSDTEKNNYIKKIEEILLKKDSFLILPINFQNFKNMKYFGVLETLMNDNDEVHLF